jgi:Peroxidase, family 2
MVRDSIIASTTLPPKMSIGAHAHLRLFRNLGLIPRDGRNITFRELSTSIRSTYNFAPSFCLYVPRYIARILNRSYNTGHFNLSDIDVHNGIEHDASLVRKYQNKNIPHLTPNPLKK